MRSFPHPRHSGVRHVILVVLFVIPAKAGIWMRPPRIILRMHPVTLRGLECSHEYVVGRRTGDSRLRGNDVLRGGNDVLRGGNDMTDAGMTC